MQTGAVSSWQVNPLDLGPLYPFVGFEFVLVGICAMFWIGYTVWQIRFEHERCRRESDYLARAGILGRAVETQSAAD